MRVLITRPAGDAQAAAESLRARGHDVLACPLISIEKTPEQKISLVATQGFIVSDADGARALADAVGVRTFPVFCESAGTAAELGRLGFQDARSAEGDAPAIARLIERSISPKLGGLVYVCSTSAPINLSAMLGNMGFAARMTPLYAISRADALPRQIAEALKNDALDGAVFFSADEARAFAQLVQRANLDATTARLIAVVASPVVAAPLTVLKFARVVSAPKSDIASVMAMVEDTLLPQPEPEIVTPEPAIIVPEPEAVGPAIEPMPALEPLAAPIPEPQPDIVEPIAEPTAAVMTETEPTDAEPLTIPELGVPESGQKNGLFSLLGALFAARPASLEQAPSERAAVENGEPAPDVEQPPEPPAIFPAQIEILEPTPSEVIALEGPAEEVTPPPTEAIETFKPKSVFATLASVFARRAQPIENAPASVEVEQMPEPAIALGVELQTPPVEIEPEAPHIESDLPADESAKAKSAFAIFESLFTRRTESIEDAPIVVDAAQAPENAGALTETIEPELPSEVIAPEAQIADVTIPDAVELEPVELDNALQEKPEPVPLADEEQTPEPAAAIQREGLFDRVRGFFTPRAAPIPEPAATLPDEPAPEEEPARIAEPTPEPIPEPIADVVAERVEEISVEPEPDIIIQEQAPDVAPAMEVPADINNEPPKPKPRLWSSVKGLFARKQIVAAQAPVLIPPNELADEKEQQPVDVFTTEIAPPAPEFLHPLEPEAEPQPPPEPEPVMETVTAQPNTQALPQENMDEEEEKEVKSPPKEKPLPTMPIAASITPEPQPDTERARVEQAELKDLFIPPMATDQDDTDKQTPNDAESPRTVRGGGRAARLLAEDAADARALNQRFKMPGSEPAPEAEPEPAETLSTMAGAAMAGTATARSSRGSARVVYTLLALIIIVVGGIVSAPRWAPQIQSAFNASAPTEKIQTAPVQASNAVPAPNTDQFTALQARADGLAKDVAALNARLAAVEQRPAAVGAGDTTALVQRIAALETAAKANAPDELATSVTNQARQLTNVSARIATLESAIGNVAKLEDLAMRLSALEGKSAEANSVLALGERVTSIEKRDSVAATALVLATAQLRDGVRAGRPYAVELETVNQLAARANVTFEAGALTSSAAKGLARTDALKAAFPEMAARAVRSDVVPGDTAGWLKRILNRALSIISVRPFGNIEGTTPGAILARAEQALRADNVAQAVSEIETLTGPPAEAAAAWLVMAKANVSTERALDELAARSVGAMSAITQTKPVTSAP